MGDIQLAIEELAISGTVCISRRSPSTLRRWCRDINRALEHMRYDWRVRADYSDMTLKVAEN